MKLLPIQARDAARGLGSQRFNSVPGHHISKVLASLSILHITGSGCYCCCTIPSSSSGYLLLNRSSRNILWAPRWLTVPAHKTRVVDEVVTTFSSFQVP